MKLMFGLNLEGCRDASGDDWMGFRDQVSIEN